MKLFLTTFFTALTLTIFAQWSTLALPEARCCMSALTTTNKVYFAGGQKSQNPTVVASNKVDIFDIKTHQWTTAQLSVARAGMAAASVGSKLLFAGGDFNYATYYSNVDIYDTLTNQWTLYNLPKKCTDMAAASLKNKAYFAGGSDGDFPQKTVYVFDAATNAWTTKEMSVARAKLTASAVGDKVLFGGGVSWITGVSSVVDIYNTTTDTWTTAQLSVPRYYIKSATVGNKVFFVGGLKTDLTPSNAVDIYDNATGLWSIKTLATARLGHDLAVIGNKLYIGGGEDYVGTYFKSVEVYDASLNQWQTTQQLAAPRTSITAASVGGYIFFAGGEQTALPVSGVVDISPSLRIATHEYQKNNITIYPSVSSDYIVCRLDQTPKLDKMTVEIIDMLGQIHQVKILDNTNFNLLDISQLPKGTYKLRVLAEQNFWLGSFVKL